jgi:large repetitive protein
MLVAAMAALGVAAGPPAHAADGTLSYVASGSAAANQASHTIQIPSSVQAGDSLLLFLTTNDSTITVNTPSGWTWSSRSTATAFAVGRGPVPRQRGSSAPT